MKAKRQNTNGKDSVIGKFPCLQSTINFPYSTIKWIGGEMGNVQAGSLT